MTAQPLDAQPRDAEALAGCEDEPIRVPGAVQAHGALLAVREPGLEVVVASANAGDVLGRRPRTLRELLDAEALARLGDLSEEGGPLRVQVDGALHDVTAHRADGLLVTDWEPVEGASEAGEVWHRRLPAVLQRLSAAGTVEDLVRLLAVDVRTLTGFDRVMVYRFDEDWNGEVVAEERREDLEPFLGLHYPASDIPAQARALYTTSWLRLIPDARYRPVPLLPPAVDGRPLDLSGSALRSVSPVHLEYLANMGVAASMSVSLIDRGRLWGLIACHHYSGPRRPSPADRTAAEFLGRTASLLLHTKAAEGDREGVVTVAESAARLVAQVGRTPRTPVAALTGEGTTVLDLVPCTGAAVRLDGRLVLLGDTPPAARVLALVPALLDDGAAAVSDLGVREPDVAASASGVLAVEVGPGDFLAWFRRESLREVTWAGDPRTGKVVQDERGLRLSPRRSFAAWSETVRGTCARWADHEVAAAGALARHLADAALARSREDDRLADALQRTLLLEQLPEVPGVALAARYRPSAQDVVGGDWYDLVVLPDGRVTVVLGDAAGHGLTAAAVTAQLRHALRAHLLRDLGPAGALAALNGLVAALLPGEMATVVVVELDPATGRASVASAGHLPVVHRAADGVRLVREGRGPALGLLDDAVYPQAEVRLAADHRLLLMTDGLVEVRGRDVQEGLDRLCDVVAGLGPDPAALLDGVLDALQPPDADDVTLLVLGPEAASG